MKKGLTLTKLSLEYFPEDQQSTELYVDLDNFQNTLDERTTELENNKARFRSITSRIKKILCKSLNNEIF